MSATNSKRGKSKGKKTAPRQGDPNFLTPTQLRNRRKRRAAKHHRSQQHEVVERGTHDNGDRVAHAPLPPDPSLTYIVDPTAAPVVAAARAHFAAAAIPFAVHVGPRQGWRTAAKLAVRPDPRTGRAALGLFLPRSHKLRPVPACRAHHPAINRAAARIEAASHAAGVAPYRADAGEATAGGAPPAGAGAGEGGRLKYVAINVARDTGAVQITLVWHAPPPPPPAREGDSRGRRGRKYDDVTDPALERLVSRLLAMGDEEVREALGAADDARGPPPGAGLLAQKKRRRRAQLRDDGAREASGLPTAASPEKKKRRRGRRDDRAVDSPAVPVADTGGPLPAFRLHSLWVNYNAAGRHANAIFSFATDAWRRIRGPQAVVERLDLRTASPGPGRAAPPALEFPVPLSFPPYVFRQANLDAFAQIVGRIRERLLALATDDDKHLSCVELYGGVGTIGLHLSDVVASLVSSDENPHNAECFRASVSKLPTHVQSRLSYRGKSAADMVTSERALFEDCTVLIVDPPRRGLDREVVEYLCGEGFPALRLVVYVSCGFPAFRRDYETLTQSGRWKVEFAEGYLLFPGSDAIETLAFFVPA